MSSCLEGTGCALCFLMSDSLALRKNFPLIGFISTATCPMCLCGLAKEWASFPCEPGSVAGRAGKLPSLPLARNDLFRYILCNFSNFLFEQASKHKKWQKFTTEEKTCLFACWLDIIVSKREKEKTSCPCWNKKRIQKSMKKFGRKFFCQMQYIHPKRPSCLAVQLQWSLMAAEGVGWGRIGLDKAKQSFNPPLVLSSEISWMIHNLSSLYRGS